jgi:phage terminase large subunit
MDTLQKVLQEQVPKESYHKNETDHFIKFSNGSEIWVDGLDDKDRVDKILGREYATIFFNEISQIPYDTVTTVLTRLSQQVEGCRPMAYYDCNPGGRQHWGNRLFIQGIDPITGEQIGKGYAYLKINPIDNKDNIADGFIDEILAKLPEQKRKRFLSGEWTDQEGVIFTNWDMIDEIPEEIKLHSRQAYGIDFGFSIDPAAIVHLYLNGDDLYLDELLYETGLTNPMLAQKMKEVGIVYVDTIHADSAEPKSIAEIASYNFLIDGAMKGPDSVRAGIDWMLSKNIHVTKRSVNLQMELENYSWKKNRDGRDVPVPIDDFNHAIDATRYGASQWMDVSANAFWHDPGYSLSDLGL